MWASEWTEFQNNTERKTGASTTQGSADLLQKWLSVINFSKNNFVN